MTEVHTEAVAQAVAAKFEEEAPGLVEADQMADALGVTVTDVERIIVAINQCDSGVRVAPVDGVPGRVYAIEGVR